MHRLVRLIYCSRVKGIFVEKDFNDIIEASDKNNQRDLITGVLCFSEGIFFQCLEGSRKNVNELYSVIQKDSRHSHHCLLDFSEIAEREFLDWSIGWLTDAVNIKYSSTLSFNPYDMSSENCLKMLQNLAKSQSMQRTCIMPVI